MTTKKTTKLPSIKIKKTDRYAYFPKESEDGVGFKVFAVHNLVISPFRVVTHDTYLNIKLTKSMYGCLLATGDLIKRGVVVNGVFSGDTDLKITLQNATGNPVTIKRGDEIGQLIFSKKELGFCIQEEE